MVRASQTALDLARIQYKAGLTDFLTVLDSERTLAGDQDQLAQSQVSAVTNLISLYKALGGGWDPATLHYVGYGGSARCRPQRVAAVAGQS